MSVLDPVRYNTKIKQYPDGRTITVYASKQIFAPPSEDPDQDLDDGDAADPGADLVLEDSDLDLDEDPGSDVSNLYRAMIRAKDRIFDIAFANVDLWTHFLTLTIDPAKLDSKSVPETMRKMSKWLDNMSQRYGLKYLLCPEYHNSGRIHAHALIHAGELQLVDSGTRNVAGYDKPMKLATVAKLGLESQVLDVIYNVPQWQYGFTTAVPIYGDGGALATYVTKYITKNCSKIFGKYYWSSRDLKREVDTYYADTPFDEVPGKAFEVPGAGLRLKYESGMTYVSG